MAVTHVAKYERLMVPRILWGSLLASTVMTLGVLFLVRQQGEVPAKLENPLFFPMLGGIGVCIAIASVMLPARLRRQAMQHAKLAVVEEVDESGAVGMFRQAAPKVRVFKDGKQARATALASYVTALIVGMALAEAVSLFGFVLGFLGAPPLHVLPFWVLAWILMVPRFPTDKAIDAPLERAYDARLR